MDSIYYPDVINLENLEFIYWTDASLTNAGNNWGTDTTTTYTGVIFQQQIDELTGGTDDFSTMLVK